MNAFGGLAYPLGNCVAAAEDEIEPAQVEPGDGPGIKGEQIPIMAAGSGKPVENRCADRHRFYPLRDGARMMEEGKECCIREEFAKLLEDPLSATHSGQPVVNQSNFHRIRKS